MMLRPALLISALLSTSQAHAQAADAAGGGASSLLFMGAIMVAMFFLMIRPQMKQAKEQKNMLAALAKGDEVVTTGGLAGKVNEVLDNFVKLEIAANTEVLVQKGAIATVLQKGSLKNA